MSDVKSERRYPAPIETEVYRAIRRAITSLAMPPGQRLLVAELADRYDVSATPVRVALSRLERDGLVYARPRRGSVVAPLALGELEVIQAHRMGLEALLAYRGASRCTVADINRMESRLNDADAAAELSEWERHVRAQWALRDVCYENADMPHVLKELADQRSRAERYMAMLSSQVPAIVGARDYELELIAACREGNREAAARCSADAQRWALERITTLIRHPTQEPRTSRQVWPTTAITKTKGSSRNHRPPEDP